MEKVTPYMKRIIALIALLAVTAGALVGCDSGGGGSTTSGTDTNASTTTTNR
jgi:hypothetical protein